jgi:chromosomal replication initiator protein
MQLDMIDSYDAQTQQILCDLWTNIVQHLGQSVDSKKIISFLAKAAVIGLDESEKTVHIGVPNEFVLTQVKKFFPQAIQEAVHIVYNNQFAVSFSICADLHDAKHPLLVDVKKLLDIKEKTKKQDISPAMRDTLSEYFGILLDPNYTFDVFVVWEHNRFAFSAAKAAAEDPGNAYNPLFLYGNVGLGKTHLMQSVGNAIIQTDPTKVVLYLPVGKLIDEIVSAIKTNKLQNLIKKFDDVDVLIIDDIQFLANKEKTQEIFHNIFNDFHMKKKQVILSSDRPPKELINIEPRLKSRFGLWLVADIQSPDYETRLAIAHAKLDAKDEQIDDHLLWNYRISYQRQCQRVGMSNQYFTHQKKAPMISDWTGCKQLSPDTWLYGCQK